MYCAYQYWLVHRARTTLDDVYYGAKLVKASTWTSNSCYSMTGALISWVGGPLCIGKLKWYTSEPC